MKPNVGVWVLYGGVERALEEMDKDDIVAALELGMRERTLTRREGVIIKLHRMIIAV